MSDSLIVEDERTYNWTSDCNNCDKKIYWNHQVRHKKTRRCLPLENEYVAGITPVRHQCMKDGTKTGEFLDKYGNKIKMVNMREYDYHQRHYMCIECAREYNKLVYSKCPSCWKKECRKCGNKQSYIYRKAEDLNKCFKCGYDRLDPDHVWSAYARLYGKEIL